MTIQVDVLAKIVDNGGIITTGILHRRYGYKMPDAENYLAELLGRKVIRLKEKSKTIRYPNFGRTPNVFILIKSYLGKTKYLL